MKDKKVDLQIVQNAKHIFCIYHSADLDGICSRDVVWKYAINHNIGFSSQGWDYGQPIPEIPKEADTVIVADVSLTNEAMQDLDKKHNQINGDFFVVWIDHHIGAIRTAEGEAYENLPGIRQVGGAACELTHQWLFPKEEVPLIVQILSAYDVWNKERFDWETVTLPFQYSMRKYDHINQMLLRQSDEGNARIIDEFIKETIFEGLGILKFLKAKDSKTCQSAAFEATCGEYKMLCLNSQEFSSNTFLSMWNEEGYDIMMNFAFTGEFFKCSLYTTKDIDVSAIAKVFGGGGHKQAAGFQLSLTRLKEFLTSKILMY